MRIGTRFFAIVAAVVGMIFFTSCGCGKQRNVLRVGIDPSWYPLNFSEQQDSVNGYIEELLLEIAQFSGLEFERFRANWDSLYDGMKAESYDAVISALPRTNYHLARYEFSENILNLGPVLVLPQESHYKSLEELSNELVGVLAGDQTVLILQKYPEVIMRNYHSISDALEAVVNGDIEGVLLDRLPAVSYVRNLYGDQLKIEGVPLNDLGLHLVVPKGRNPRSSAQFEKGLEYLIKKKRLEALLKKWHLQE